MKHIATDVENSIVGLDAEKVWDINLAYVHMRAGGQIDSKRTAERRLNALRVLPQELSEELLKDELGRSPNRLVIDYAIKKARQQRYRVLFVQLSALPNGKPCLHANDARGARFWVPLRRTDTLDCRNALMDLQKHINKPIAVFPHGVLVANLRNMPTISNIHNCPQAYHPVLATCLNAQVSGKSSLPHSLQLKRLEAESIYIIREAFAEAQNPCMLYSFGKDSGVMLHLARKAFFPAPPPFPLLHVDTRWKFQEMYLFRDFMVSESGLDLLVHTNPDAIVKNINPFDHDSALYTIITKTEGLQQALPLQVRCGV